MDSSTPNASTLDRSLAFRVTNPGPAAVRVRVEPWAREYDLPAGSSRDFHLAGPDPAEIEVAVMPTEITIYGWAGAVLDGIGLPVPSLSERPDDTPAR